MHGEPATLEPAKDPFGETSRWSAPGGLREALITALPLMISSLSWTIMNFIDRLFLLKYSPDAVAASLPASIMSFAVIAFPLGVASYAATFVAQYEGSGRRHRVGPAVWQAIWIGLIATPLAVAVVPLSPWLFAGVGNPPQLVDLEVIYFRTISFSGGAIVLSGAVQSYLNGLGRVKTVMIVDTIGAMVNVALDYCWIFGYGGFPEWGIAGAGWATTVALWFKTAMYFWLFLRVREDVQCHTRRGWAFDAAQMGRLLRYGAVSGVQMMLEVAAFGLFTLLVGKLGVVALAATTLAFNVNNFAFMPIWGVGIAASTMVGRRLGEDRPDLAERSTWSAMVWGLLYMGAICSLYVGVPGFVLWAYEWSANDENFAVLRDEAIVLLRFVAAFGLIDAANVIFSGALKGAGDVRFVLISSVAIAAVGVAATWGGIKFGLGLYWCWIVLTAWVAALCLAYWIRFLHGHWKTMRVIEPTP